MPTSISSAVNTPAQLVLCMSAADTTEYTATTAAFNSKKIYTFTLPANAVITGLYIEADLKSSGGQVARASLKMPASGTETTQITSTSGTYEKKKLISPVAQTLAYSYWQPNNSTVTIEIGLNDVTGTGTVYMDNSKVGVMYYIAVQVLDSPLFA